MIFKTIIQPTVQLEELVSIYTMDGKLIDGIVEKVDKKYIWIKQKDKEPIKFSLKVNQVVKLN